MKQILVIVVLVTGCAAGRKAPTIRGADLYAHAVELRSSGSAMVPSSDQPIVVKRDQFLIDHSRDQVFAVWQVVEGCNGRSLAEDPDCALALMQDQRFVVVDEAPEPKRLRAEEADISPLDKARLVLLAAGTALAVGAVKCDAFDGCGTLLGIAAGADALLLLLTLGGRD